ncbi:short-chain dehydrogenase [Streptomyces sp. CLI2509]|nr:short-chain dehydrogenase [Streptomyces sp. CLI2509]
MPERRAEDGTGRDAEAADGTGRDAEAADGAGTASGGGDRKGGADRTNDAGTPDQTADADRTNEAGDGAGATNDADRTSPTGRPDRERAGAAPGGDPSAPPPADVRESWVETGGVRLRVLERGDAARPTVLLVHGYPDSQEVWEEVAEFLADRFHVVTYDVRGHGGSTAPLPLRGGFTLPKLTDDFLAVAHAVSPTRPVHLVGHDWGSVQGWEFATVGRTQGRIASFTSISGPSLDHLGHWYARRGRHPSPEGLLQLVDQGLKSWYIGALHLPRLPELAWRGPLGRAWPRVLRRAEKLSSTAYPTASLPSDAANGAWLYRDNILPRLRRPRPDAFAHVPVQLVIPTRDAFLSPYLYDKVGDWTPRGLRRRAVPAKHWLPRSRPELLAGWIADFVAEHEVLGEDKD